MAIGGAINAGVNTYNNYQARLNYQGPKINPDIPEVSPAMDNVMADIAAPPASAETVGTSLPAASGAGKNVPVVDPNFTPDYSATGPTSASVSLPQSTSGTNFSAADVAFGAAEAGRSGLESAVLSTAVAPLAIATSPIGSVITLTTYAGVNNYLGLPVTLQGAAFSIGVSRVVGPVAGSLGAASNSAVGNAVWRANGAVLETGVGFASP